MMSLDKVVHGLGKLIADAKLKRHWSYVDVSEEIAKLGGRVSPKTVENVEKGDSNYVFANVYWICRALGYTLGEALSFTVDDADLEAHALLAAILRNGGADATHIRGTLKFMNKR